MNASHPGPATNSFAHNGESSPPRVGCVDFRNLIDSGRIVFRGKPILALDRSEILDALAQALARVHELESTHRDASSLRISLETESTTFDEMEDELRGMGWKDEDLRGLAKTMATIIKATRGESP